MLKKCLLILCSLLFAILLLEGILRILPVNEGMRTQAVNDASPIIRFQPDRTFTWSRFADFSMRNEVHANNYGFINDQDYTPDSQLPLISIIGDSYVEASMIPYEKTLQGLLTAELQGDWRVYSFGVSGAPLSQYLAFAKYARETFKTNKIVFVIVGNDFDESLLHYKQSPGMHYFKQTSSGDLKLTRLDYSPSTIRSLLKHSRLVMYLYGNLQAHTTLSQLFGPTARPESYVGQTSASTDSMRLALSEQAVMNFFDLLPEYSGLQTKDILFIVDGLRPHLYSREALAMAEGSFADRMRKFFIQSAQRHGYTTIDLSPIFIEEYSTHQQRFEFKRDGHWNDAGHAIAARAVLPHLAR